jgi:EmrB/QacA subfamily drug resistance transporter
MWALLLGGLGGGLANDYALVLLARVAEGLAAGVVQPIPAIIILRAFAPGEQGRASGLFGTGVVMAPAIGPSIGGVLVDAFGWRSIFFMVVPLALLGLWLARRYVPTTAPGGVAANADSAGLDWLGLALASASTLMLLNGLVQLRGEGGYGAWVLMSLAALGALSFVLWQRRLLHTARHGGRSALMNLQVFRHRNFAMGSLVAFTYGTALFGSTYLYPVYMQMALGLSPSYIGAALLPSGILLALTINIVGRLADRYPASRLVMLGLCLLALSFGLNFTVHPAQGLAWLWVWIIVGRIGLGFILPSLNLGAMRGVPHTLIPQGSSIINFIRMVGGATGVSLCAIVLEWRLSAHGAQLGEVASAAALRAFNETFACLAALTALALLAAWHLGRPERPAHKDE